MRFSATAPPSWSRLLRLAQDPERSRRTPEAIRQLFDEISGGYDCFNSLFSGMLDRRWRRQTVLVLSPSHGGRYLDLCTGTGQLAFELLRQVQGDARVIGLDFSERMLAAAARRWHVQCRRNGARPLFEMKKGPGPFFLVQAQAETLPFPANFFDGVTCGFSLRNVADLDQVLREIQRVLKPYGIAALLETSQPTHPLVRWWRNVYLECVMPIFGLVTTGRWDPFRYFQRSVKAFDPPNEVMTKLSRAGFTATHYIPLTQELVAIYKAVK